MGWVLNLVHPPLMGALRLHSGQIVTIASDDEPRKLLMSNSACVCVRREAWQVQGTKIRPSNLVRRCLTVASRLRALGNITFALCVEPAP